MCGFELDSDLDVDAVVLVVVGATQRSQTTSGYGAQINVESGKSSGT